MPSQTIERKIEGGKLLRVRIDYEGEYIKRVKITGDFFVYPDYKISKLEEALADRRIDEVPSIINEVLKDATIVGFSVEDLISMITERKTRWRFLPLRAYEPSFNMAADEYLMRYVKRTGIPIIRFYTWNRPAVTIGYFQSAHEEVNVDACDRDAVPIIRRLTGGGAVYHTSDEITYSVIAPAEMFPSDIIASYNKICNCIIRGLKKVGIDAVFAPINDVLVDGKKISGNAQTRRDGVLLQHGTVLYDVDADRMFTYLKVGSEKLRDKLIRSARERITCLKRYTDLGLKDIYIKLKETFLEGKEAFDRDFSSKEIKEIEKIRNGRYEREDWNFLR